MCKTMGWISVTAAVAALSALGGCGSGDTCAEAAEHVGACLEEGQAKPVTQCDRERAEQILTQDCDTVRKTAAAGKADGWWDDFMCGMGYYSYCDPFGADAGLLPMLGDWELFSDHRGGWSPGSVIGCPPAMRVVRTDDEQGRPSLGLRQIEEDGSTGYRVYDRADLININGGEECSTIEIDSTTALKICHRTRVTDPGALEHRIWLGEKVGYQVKPFTWGSETATQRIALQGPALIYEWDIDGELADRCIFNRR